jgi:hypothetical protein
MSEVKEESTSSSNMDFVLWFMGSKQDPNSTISTEGVIQRKNNDYWFSAKSRS